MHVALRVDGGPQIGYGHLIRSGALASELQSRGHTITVATTTSRSANAVFPERVTTVELQSRADPNPFVEWLDTAHPDIVFTDAYPIDTTYQKAVQQQVPLAVLQDDARHAVCADLFVNGNLYASDLDYEFLGPSPETCLGTEYVLLRREICERAVEELPWREPPKQAIVTMGGSDSMKLTPTVMKAFDGLDLTVDAIVGPGFSSEQERDIRKAAADTAANIRVIHNPADLVERIAQADFAVSTASTTTYELLALGTPIVSIPVAENQMLIASALRSRDAATVLEPGSNKAAIKDAAERYVSEPELRRERRDQGRSLVDTRGTSRVATELLNCI